MILDICKKLAYHRLDISMSPEEDVNIDGWLGATIRNSLLFATEQVKVKDGISLFTIINRLAVPEDHPLYKPLSGGFPKGFSIFIQKPIDIFSSQLVLHSGERVVFSLFLIGTYSNYYESFIEAVRFMCNRGIGGSRIPFQLHEICEKDGFGRSNRIAVGYSEKISVLRCPIHWEDFEEEKFGQRERVISLRLKAPMLLAFPTEKINQRISYQDKLNGFPSFYQFVRSAVLRCIKLAALYACPNNFELYQQALESVDSYITQAASVLLTRADIRWVNMRGPGRNNGRPPVSLSGYVGEMIFLGDFNAYMPLLSFMQMIGVGNDTVYGLGGYQIEVLKMTESR